MINRLALSGSCRSGKDFTAIQCGYQVIGFADPIYAITKYYFGTCDKSVPGIRQFMQFVGQVGWGFFDSENYKASPERATLIHQVRHFGKSEMMENIQYTYPDLYEAAKTFDWNNFGLSKTFWVDLLLARVRLLQEQKKDLRIAVTNVRFEHELVPLKEAGFEHYHVMCSEETRMSRLSEEEKKHLNDNSEAFAKVLDKEMPRSKIIWSDEKVSPPNEALSFQAFHTIEQFKSISTGK